MHAYISLHQDINVPTLARFKFVFASYEGRKRHQTKIKGKKRRLSSYPYLDNK